MARIPPRVRAEVLRRDRRCIASLLVPHTCADTLGSVHPPTDTKRLELDHVREQAMIGKTAPSLPEHLVALCGRAHQSSGWATSNREVLLAYLALCRGGPPPLVAVRQLRALVHPAPYAMSRGISA